jgi:hypothetical protein
MQTTEKRRSSGSIQMIKKLQTASIMLPGMRFHKKIEAMDFGKTRGQPDQLSGFCPQVTGPAARAET